MHELAELDPFRGLHGRRILLPVTFSFVATSKIKYTPDVRLFTRQSATNRCYPRVRNFRTRFRVRIPVLPLLINTLRGCLPYLSRFQPQG